LRRLPEELHTVVSSDGIRLAICEVRAHAELLADLMNRFSRLLVTLENGPFTICKESGVATAHGREVHLTGKEFALFHLLMLHKGAVVPNRQILLTVWGPAYTDPSYVHYIRVAMAKLRRKINDADGQVLLAEWGKGYKMAVL
jgi:two-component system KDP operon response regulator KdpE